MYNVQCTRRQHSKKWYTSNYWDSKTPMLKIICCHWYIYALSILSNKTFRPSNLNDFVCLRLLLRLCLSQKFCVCRLFESWWLSLLLFFFFSWFTCIRYFCRIFSLTFLIKWMFVFNIERYDKFTAQFGGMKRLFNNKKMRSKEKKVWKNGWDVKLKFNKL